MLLGDIPVTVMWLCGVRRLGIYHWVFFPLFTSFAAKHKVLVSVSLVPIAIEH